VQPAGQCIAWPTLGSGVRIGFGRSPSGRNEVPLLRHWLLQHESEMRGLSAKTKQREEVAHPRPFSFAQFEFVLRVL
jgi:hypothetical protein